MVNFEEIDSSNGEAETSMPPSQECLLDAEEIEKAAANMTRPTARMRLESLAKKLRKESDALKRVEANHGETIASNQTEEKQEKMETDAFQKEKVTPVASVPEPPSPKKTTPAVAPHVSSSMQYVPIDKFAFDAGGYNSPFVTLYIDLPGVGSIPKENITCNFTANSFDLIINDLNGKSYRLWKDNLENEVDVDNSKKIVKADKVLVKLAKKKSEYGSYDYWQALTAKKKKKPDTKENPAAGIMDMMKEMYETGDDNMRKVIGETMMKQRKGELDSGMGGMGGLGDMGGDFDV